MDSSSDNEPNSTQKKIRGKRKAKVSQKNDVPKKKQKLIGKKVKPPTAEEINLLRETENVFHSNLFRLQIEETLKEVKMKHSTCERIDSFIEKLKECLLSIQFSASKKPSDCESIDISKAPSMMIEPKHAETSFEFEKPTSVQVFGSFNIGCTIKNSINVDIVVEMPRKIFVKNDYLNEKYFRKRRYYLSCLASRLLLSSEELLLDSNIQFIIKNSIDKPILLLKSSDKKLKKCSFFIHAVPEQGTFKEARFSPTHNNVRYNWYFNENTDNDKMNLPTPYYNSVICQDLITLKNEEVRVNVFSNNQNFKDAFVLLKIWLRQRKLDEGIGSFTGYLMSMFIVYLYKNRKLNQHMSSYQVIRNVWVALGQTDWHKGLSLCDLGENKEKVLLSFKTTYDIILIDITGSVNLASLLSLDTYLVVKAESKYGVDCLDNQAANFFPALFMTQMPFLQQYDHILRFNDQTIIEQTVEKYVEVQERLDVRNDKYKLFAKLVANMLKRTLNNRVKRIFYYIEPSNLKWSVSEEMPSWNNITIGLEVDPEFAYNIIDKGPVANLPEAVDFRKFWGSKAELRRFKDGDVCEVVCWGSTNDSMRKKRSIMQSIVEYILKNKFQITKDHYNYIFDEVESVIYNELEKIFGFEGTGEELTSKVVSTFDELCKQLREMEDIPLVITSIQGISPVFRFTEPFPLISGISSNFKRTTDLVNKKIIFKKDQIVKHIPLYVPTIEAAVQFSLTNKWPEDLGAIRRLQSAFYIKLSEVLRNKYNYISQPHITHLDIVKSGYVFRLKISNNNEITAVKRRLNEEGIIEFCDNEESLSLERKLIQLPTLTSSLHGLHQQFPAYGASCSISKRWLRCHLIDEYHFPDICVDLLISYIFLYPQPYMTTHQPQTVFLRFLSLLSSTNWFTEPIVVNFNNELTREDIIEIDSHFNNNRSNLPPLFIVTPFDKTGITWTKEEPSLVILSRVAKLAEAALRSLEKALFLPKNFNSIQQIFRPPLKGYDILIRTHAPINPLRWMAFETKAGTWPSVVLSSCEKLPILEFHPVQLFVNELRKHYSEQCMFLFDFYGGNVIGVVFKPNALQPVDFKITNLKCSQLNKKKISLNVDALIEDFYILGKGVVSSIEKCK